MSKFKLLLISPLAGSTLSTLFKVLRGNRIALKHYAKVAITFIVVLISSAFHWIDRLFFRKKVDAFVFQKSPLFIIGHWRSGTTLLHNILTQDASAGYVSTYHAVFPNNLKSKWLFKNFMRLFMPGNRPADNLKISVDYPQEDEFAMSNTTSLSFYRFFYFPSTYRSLYNKSIRFKSISETEEEDWKLKYRTLVIKALINTNKKRAVLKNPANTGRMLELVGIFPCAQFVHIVRNPIIVYLSTKKFFSKLFPTLNLERFSQEKLCEMILELYSQLLQDYLSDKKDMKPDKVVEVRYEELQLDPIKVIKKIYSKFELGNFNNFQPALSEYLATQKGHKTNSYRIDRNELDRVMPKLDFAMKHWGYDIPDELEIIESEVMREEKMLTK